jgi:hypothetical protein
MSKEEKVKEWPPCPTIMGYDPAWKEKTRALGTTPYVPEAALPTKGRQGVKRTPCPT